MTEIIKAKMNTLGGRMETVISLLEDKIKIEDHYRNNDSFGKAMGYTDAVKMIKDALYNNGEILELYANLSNRILEKVGE